MKAESLPQTNFYMKLPIR